ncbi:MAG: flavodoxin domain-containing protein [Methanobacteriaceae archaeon]|nr:flavodoxin domain-containing protein [Methanobacteriaceae archaeon]
MNIGIIVYSQTENTYSVALKLQEKLSEDGNSVNVQRVVLAGDVDSWSKDITLETAPDIEGYDALIFGSPVHAFSLAKAMSAYLNQLPSLEHKKIACFVTKGMPLNWTGGNQAISQMKKTCQSKGGTVIGTEIVVWNKKRDKNIAELAERFSGLF